jgi:MoaD family protein
MHVSIKYFGIFRNVTAKEKDDLILGDGEDIHSLLDRLANKYGEEFKKYIYHGDKKEILGTTFVFINGKIISKLNGINTKLQNNDSIVITPIMTGG